MTNSLRQPIRVLFVISSLNRGGTEMRLVEIINGLDRDRFEARLFVAKGGELIPEVREHLAEADVKRSAAVLERLRRLWAVLYDWRPDVVWCVQGGLLGFTGRIMARVQGVPVIILSLHGHRAGGSGLDWPNVALTRLLRTPVVVVSHTLYRALLGQGIPAGYLTVIPNGVDSARFCPAPPGSRRDGIVVGTVGNLLPVKGHKLLIQAAAQIVQDHPEVQFLIVGEGQERPRLERLIADLQLSLHVRLLGRRNDIPDILRTLDLFVLTSHHEGMPNVVLEAMATGLPVVTTDFGDAAALIGEDAGIVLTGRDPAALATTILELIEDPAQIAAMGSAARQRAVTRFSQEQMIRAREQLILEQLARRRPA